MSPASRPTVLYFAGSGRSGTTLINSILGSMPGVFAAGELRYLWQRGLVENHRCSCGSEFDRCPLWGEVMQALASRQGPAVDNAGGIGARLLTRLQVRRVPGMLVRWRTGRVAVPDHPDDATIAALYEVVSQVTGASVVVDSSKLPPYGMLLAQMGIDLRVLHVVRDPRATAFSWRRKKKALDHADDATLMPRQAIPKSSFLWLFWNAVTVLRWGSRRTPYLRLRYEDFVADPQVAMAKVCQLAGLDPADLPFAGPDQVTITPTHVVAGNPNRHERGQIAIRADEQWRGSMRRRDRWSVTMLTAPGLLGFGYPLRPRSVPAPTTPPSSTRRRRNLDAA